VGNNANAFLFAAYPNWGSGNNNGDLQSAQTYAGGPGQLSSLTVFNDTYTYDGVNRLTGVYETGGSNNQLYGRYFGYDPYGNIWITANAGVPESGMTPNNNVYNSGNNRITGGSYDASGNQTVIGSYSIAYDAENHQTTALDNTTQGQATYVYDGDGRRVQKIIQNGPITTYVYDAEGKLVAEYSSVGPPTSPCYTCYLSSDHLGSTRLVTDQNANVIARHDYLPSGEEIPGGLPGRSSTWGTADNVNQKFTGKVRDSETGQDFFGARYFGSPLGRFSSPDPENAGADPSDPETWNAYAYVSNQPLTLTDPDGRAQADDPCRGKPKPCWSTTVTAKLEEVALSAAVSVVQMGGQTRQALQTVVDWAGQPRNPTCLAASTAAGASAGAGIGMLGVAGGPAVGATEPAGFLIGGGVGWLGGMSACMSSTGGGGGGSTGGAGNGGSTGESKVKFGNNPNQEHHTFRHVEEAGIDKQAAEQAIRNDLAGNESTLPQGLTTRQVTVSGRTLQYNAFKLPGGTINVGRITVH